MKRSILLLALLFSIAAYAQETRDIIVRNPIGNYVERYRALASDTTVKHGTYRRMAFNGGAPKLLGQYKLGKKDGRWQEFSYWDMFIVGLGNYTEDKRTGIWTFCSKLNVKEQEYDYDKKQVVFYAKDAAAKYAVVNGKDTVRNVKLDRPPLYIGGNVSALTFFISHMDVPEENIKKPINGTVIIAYLIDKNGHNIKTWVKKGLDKDVDKTVHALAKQLPDTWVAGTLKGKAVNSIYTISIPYSQM